MIGPSFTFSRNRGPKLLLVDVEGTAGTLRAHYNPREIQIDKTVPWSSHADARANESYLEFTGAPGRQITMELLLDSYEASPPRTIEDELHTLTMMTLVKQQDGPEHERRPPVLRVSNAPFPDFTCVMESLGIKITVCNADLKPVRATVTVRLKEAVRLANGKLSGSTRAP